MTALAHPPIARLVAAERLRNRVLDLHRQGVSPEGIADMVEHVPDVVRGILRRDGLLPGIRKVDLEAERAEDRARVQVPAWVPTHFVPRYRAVAVAKGPEAAASSIRRLKARP